jgi:hypothetical protein
MLDNLLDSIKGDVLGTLTEKTELSADQAESVLPIAKESIQTGLMDQVKSGNVGGILDMFNSSGNSLLKNAIFSGIKQNFVGAIIKKLNLPAPLAGMVANVGLGKIFEGISGKAKDNSGKVTQDSLMSTLGLEGGGLGDIAKDMLKNKLGGLGKGLFS